MDKFKKELLDARVELEFMELVPCTNEESLQYKKMLMNNELLPENIIENDEHKGEFMKYVILCHR